MIITIGSATKDVFIKGNFDLSNLAGKKIEANEIILETGGGGTNAAVSFSRLGFQTAFLGKIGLDVDGIYIIRELKKNNVDISLVRTSKLGTGYSVVISPYEKDRAIFVYRGANADIDFKPVKAELFYIAPLTGKSENIISQIINYARKNKIKVMMNPSKPFLMKTKKFNVDILLLNEDEAKILTNNFNQLNDYADIAVVTKGKYGCEVYTKQYKYEANSPEVNVKETTGAGDAFGSGFVAGLIKKDIKNQRFLGSLRNSLEFQRDIEFGIKLGTLNACSVIQQIGAKKGSIRWKDIKKYSNFMDKIKIRKSKI